MPKDMLGLEKRVKWRVEISLGKLAWCDREPWFRFQMWSVGVWERRRDKVEMGCVWVVIDLLGSLVDSNLKCEESERVMQVVCEGVSCKCVRVMW